MFIVKLHDGNKISYTIDRMPRIPKLVAYVDQIKEAYTNGVGLTAIAKTHGVSTGTIRNILLRAGVPMRKPGRPHAL